MESKLDKVFQESSIDLFRDRLAKWMKDVRVYYYGCFLYDINGNFYSYDRKEERLEKWMGDNDILTPDEQSFAERMEKQIIQHDLKSRLTITQIIQRGFLALESKVLHLFVDSNSVRRCEFISDTLERESFELFSSTGEGKTEIWKELVNKEKVDEEVEKGIIESFQYNFNQISPFGAHLFFFPTSLWLSHDEGILINVTTIISPSNLSDDDFNYIKGALQFGIEGLLQDTIQYLYNKEQKEAIKSAKAAIMSRNLSHNLGSHVMSYLKQSLSSVTDMEYSGALIDAFGKGEEIKKELPFLVGTGRFISYLQERQDFIATVATDYIPFPSVVNFKDAIYDELNPDYRFLRHSEWKGHKPANILLENIAKSEGLSRNMEGKEQAGNNIIIKFRKFDGLHIDNESQASYEDLRRWNFSLPGGVMGRQAVFSIVENAIRNAAKHGARDSGDNLVFTFDILDPLASVDDEFFTVYLNSKDKSDFYIVTLTDNVLTDSKDVERINKVLENPFDKNTYDLTSSNKGLKEMLISAAWLRSIRIEDYQSGDSEQAPILKARNTPEGFLQYVFCLPKVKEVALITDDKLVEQKGSDLWAKNGWYIYSVNEYKNLSGKNFSFVILDGSLSEKKEEIRRCSNNRFFVSASKKDINNREIVFDFNKCKEFTGQDEFKVALQDLYRQLASFDDVPVRITIIDTVSGTTNKGSSSYVSMLGDEERIHEAHYLYRKHNDTDKEFVGLLHSLKTRGGDLIRTLNSLQFIEGITGGNSTDRLIRREEKDDFWVYRHAHAMNTRVAIFDERVFTRITGFEMSRLKEGKRYDIDWEKRLEHLNDFDAKLTVNQYDSSHKKAIVFKEFIELERPQVIAFAQKNYPQSDPVNTCELNRISPLVYHKKGIDVFTWTKSFDSDTEKRFAIWGVRLDLGHIETETMKDDWRKNVYGRIEKVADLIVRDDEPIIQFDENNGFFETMFSFDYVSVHQGLLDKVYESKDHVRYSSKSGKESNPKLLITKELHSKFVRVSTTGNDYLPGLTIHSGRSKPNQEDMPQHQPFIQYAAIENAIFDCKYSLVDLLDFACYE